MSDAVTVTIYRGFSIFLVDTNKKRGWCPGLIVLLEAPNVVEVDDGCGRLLISPASMRDGVTPLVHCPTCGRQLDIYIGKNPYCQERKKTKKAGRSDG